jgi:Lon protease-like protein
MVLPLHIFEERYRTMVARRLDIDPMFGVVLIRSGREVGDRPETHAIGTAASLLTVVQYGDGRYDIAVRGGQRFEVIDCAWDEGYLTGTVEWLPDADSAEDPSGRMARLVDVRRAFTMYLDALQRIANIQVEHVELGNDPVAAAYAICSMMPFSTTQRQRLLEAATPQPLLDDLLATLRRERDLLVSTGIGGAAADYPGTRFTTN